MPLNRVREYLSEGEARDLRVHVRRTEEDEVEGVYILFSPTELQHILNAVRGHGALGGSFFLIHAGGQVLNEEGMSLNLG